MELTKKWHKPLAVSLKENGKPLAWSDRLRLCGWSFLPKRSLASPCRTAGPSERLPSSPTPLSIVPVAIGGCAGILLGIFVGDYAHVLRPIGELYVMLLKVAVYPYLVCSLLHGLGSMAPAQAWKLFLSGWRFYVAIWVTTFGLLAPLALGIPQAAAPPVGLLIVPRRMAQPSWRFLFPAIHLRRWPKITSQPSCFSASSTEWRSSLLRRRPPSSQFWKGFVWRASNSETPWCVWPPSRSLLFLRT